MSAPGASVIAADGEVGRRDGVARLVGRVRVDLLVGDHIGWPKTVESFVLRYGEKLSLGKQPYLAASCITILNYLLDKQTLQ